MLKSIHASNHATDIVAWFTSHRGGKLLGRDMDASGSLFDGIMNLVDDILLLLRNHSYPMDELDATLHGVGDANALLGRGGSKGNSIASVHAALEKFTDERALAACSLLLQAKHESCLFRLVLHKANEEVACAVVSLRIMEPEEPAPLFLRRRTRTEGGDAHRFDPRTTTVPTLRDPDGGTAAINTIPTEILYMCLERIRPIDRIHLGQTCKAQYTLLMEMQSPWHRSNRIVPASSLVKSSVLCQERIALLDSRLCNEHKAIKLLLWDYSNRQPVSAYNTVLLRRIVTRGEELLDALMAHPPIEYQLSFVPLCLGTSPRLYIRNPLANWVLKTPLLPYTPNTEQGKLVALSKYERILYQFLLDVTSAYLHICESAQNRTAVQWANMFDSDVLWWQLGTFVKYHGARAPKMLHELHKMHSMVFFTQHPIIWASHSSGLTSLFVGTLKLLEKLPRLEFRCTKPAVAAKAAMAEEWQDAGTFSLDPQPLEEAKEEDDAAAIPK